LYRARGAGQSVLQRAAIRGDHPSRIPHNSLAQVAQCRRARRAGGRSNHPGVWRRKIDPAQIRQAPPVMVQPE